MLSVVLGSPCNASGVVLVVTGAPKVMWSKVATVSVHALLGLLLFGRARRTDLRKSSAIYSCYMFLWKLFYAEYLLLPLFC